jgi:hypothetical protein
MANFELQFPLGGLNDNVAQSKQPSGTTNEAVNVRGQDPITGRIRGAQRSGLTKYVVESMEARVKRFEKVVYDNRQLRYVPLDSSNIKLIWEQANNNSNASTYCVVDYKENVYVVDAGRTVQKFNKNGVLVYTLAPAGLEDVNLYIRGLAVDDAGSLWIGTGHKKAADLPLSPSQLANAASLNRTRIWKYKENLAGAVPVLDYSFNPRLAIEKLALSQGILYAAANDPLLEEGYVVAYDEIYTTGMEEVARRKMPYPLCDIDVLADGKVCFTAPVNVNRPERHSQQYPNYRKTVVDWTPAQIPSDKLWSWYDASQMEGATNNERVTAWFDVSGAGRNLGCAVNETGPKYLETGWAGQPCFDFDGTAQLYTLGGQPTTEQASDGSASAFPNYVNAKWAMHIVFRPQVAENDNPIDATAYLFGVDTSQTEPHDLHVAIHKRQNLMFPGQVNANKVTLYATPNSGPSWYFTRVGSTSVKQILPFDGQPNPNLASTGNQVAYIGAGQYRFPAPATLSTVNNASVLTIVYTSGSGDGTTELECHYRFNGQPIDRWRGAQISAAAGFYLGRQAPGLSPTTTNWFKGQVAEIITLHNLDQSYVPQYPRTLGLACKSATGTFTISSSTPFDDGQTYLNNKVKTPYTAQVGASENNLAYSGFFLDADYNDSNLDLQRGDVLQANGTIVNLIQNRVPVTYFDSPGGLTPFAMVVSATWSSPSGTAVVNPSFLHSSAATYIPNVNNTNATLCEKIEGYLAWKWGIWHLLPRGNHTPPQLAMNTTYNPGNWPHPYRNAPPSSVDTDTVSKAAVTISPLAVAGCLESIDGPYRWVVDGLSGFGAGVGLRIKATTDAFYTLGDPQFAGSTTNGEYTWSDANGNGRKLVYNAATQVVSDAWSQTLASSSTTSISTTYDYIPHLSTDAFENAYYPFTFVGGAYGVGWSIVGKDAGNTPITLLSNDTNGDVVLQAAPEFVSPDYRIGNGFADDFPVTPDPLDPDTYPRAENVYVLKNGAGDEQTIERYEIVASQSDLTNPSPRAQVLLAVSNGKIKKVTPSGVSSPAGVDTLPQPELDANSPYIDCAVLFGKVYFTDGLSYRVFDPRNDTVLEWKALDAGTLPNRCKLVANWRGRAVLARGADDPHNWHMSEQGSPTNWDIFPPVQTATQAISGNNARAGLCPDLINSLIPYNDDLLLFGCDSSLWMMRGDPMAGGVFDLVSDVTGVAFGRSWAKDPEGTLYFFGSRGGVYIMKPGSVPVSMTQSTIERRLNNVNLSQFYVEMFWNTYDDGLHVFLMPFTDTASRTKHYFWERKSGAWYEDTFALTKQPSAAVVIDGDAADDRCLLIGTYDSSIVRWDKLATSDDGQLIDGKVLIGPIAPDDSEFDARVTNLAAVMANQGAVNYKLYASTTPDDKGQPVASGQFVPGRNPIHLVRARGAFVWMELQQANAFTRWSLESIRLDAYPAGRKRNG